MLTSNKLVGQRALLFSLFVIFGFILSCNKKEQATQQQTNNLLSYSGKNSSVQRLIEELNRMDNQIHLTDSLKEKGLVDWDHSVVRSSFSDTKVDYIFPIKTPSSHLDNLLSVTQAKGGKLTKVNIIGVNDITVNDSIAKEKFYTAGLVAALKSFGYDIAPGVETVVNKKASSLKIDRPIAAKIAASSSARTTDECEVIFNAGWSATVMPGSCSLDYQVIQESITDYVVEQLQQRLSTEYNATFSVSVIANVGIVIHGPIQLVSGIDQSALTTILAQILSDYMTVMDPNCPLFSLILEDVTVLSNPCNDPDPEPQDCSQKTEVQAQAEVEAALNSVEELYDIPLQQPSTNLELDANNEYYLNESPPWTFLRYTLPANYVLEYTAYFKSERYTQRTVKAWKSFIYDHQLPYTITNSSGTIPPCATLDMEILTLSTNVSPDATEATASINYKLTIKLACAFGWQVGSKSNSSPLVNPFPASRDYGSK
jgi:hypothetical protein